MDISFYIPGLNDVSSDLAHSGLISSHLPILNKMRQKGRFYPGHHTHSDLFSALFSGSLKEGIIKELDLDIAGSQSFLVSPLSQRMDLHSLAVMSGDLLGLRLGVAHQYVAVINGYLSQFQSPWTCHMYRPDLWLMTTDKPLNWTAPSLLDLGGHIDSQQKMTGADASLLLKRQTELQMLLFEHALNKNRESEGLPVINGLWFWPDMQGTLLIEEQSQALIAGNTAWIPSVNSVPNLMGVASWADIEAQLPAYHHPQHIRIYLDALSMAVHYEGVTGSQSVLESLDTHFLKPVYQLMTSGRVSRMRLFTDNTETGALMLTKRSKYAFWRRSRYYQGVWP